MKNPYDKDHPPLVSELRPNTDRRAAPEEAVTVIADFMSEPVTDVGREHERTPVVTQIKKGEQKKSAGLTGPRMFLAGLAIVALGFAGFRFIKRGGSFTRAAAATTASVQAEAEARSKQLAEEPAAEAPEPEAVTEATPAQAARSFALGEYERALAQYRFLAQQHPEIGAYAVMVKVLAAEQREH